MKHISLGVSLILFAFSELTLVKLALWQHSRLQEQKSIYQEYTSQGAHPLSVSSILDLSTWQHVKVVGMFDHEKDKFLINQRLDRRVGKRLLTPLKLASGEKVIVDRGWLSKNVQSFDSFKTSDSVEVVGIIREIKERTGTFQGPIYGMSKHEIMRVEAEPFELKPTKFYIQATSSQFEGLNAVADKPKDGSQNLEYMLTWSALAVILPLLYGWALWVRRKKA